MNRTSIINHYIKENRYQTYLELGTDNRALNFNKIICKNKFCVDINPNAKADFTGSTDDFFYLNKRTWDLIFIDALHEKEQVMRDVENSLKFLSPNGTIVMHDCNPTTERMQLPTFQTGEWTGNVWEAWVYFRRFPNLSMKVMNCDYGVGIIQRGKQTPLIIEDPTYEEFEKNKKWWLNLVSVSPISIVIPTYEQKGKGHKVLTQLLNSIRLQDFEEDYEVVISDNSEDNQIQMVCEAFTMLPVKYFRNEKRGVSANTNNAIDKASYEKIKIMFQDDLFTQKNSLELFWSALDRKGWAISNSHHLNEKNQVTYKKQTAYRHNQFERNITGMPSVVAFRKCDVRFSEDLKTMLDMKFYYDLYEKYGQPEVIKDFAIGQRFWDSSISSNQTSLKIEETKYLRQKGLIKC